jgi:hypothetical protein
MLLCLACMDAAVNLLFPYPTDPQAIPSSLERYFEYGRSVEGKLPRIVGPADESTAPIAFAGWLQPEDWEVQPSKPADEGGILIAVYGMSFAADLGDAVCARDDRFTMRFIGGPAAPPSFAYAAYELDRDRHEGKVAILGILASSVRGMQTLTGMTWNFEQPFPFTYPLYSVSGGALEAEWPEIQSLPELRAALEDPSQWNRFVNQLAESDAYYSPLLFEESVLDRSAIVRMLRRAWAQRRNLRIVHSIHGPDGFNLSAPFVPVLNTMMVKFANTCKDDGVIPIVYLVNDRGYSDHLYELLEPVLVEHGIAFISSHESVDPDNPASFVDDGHFTEAANERLGEACHTLLVRELDHLAFGLR